MKDLLGRSEKANKQQEQHAAGLDKYDALLTLLRASPTFFFLSLQFYGTKGGRQGGGEGGIPVCVCVFTQKVVEPILTLLSALLPVLLSASVTQIKFLHSFFSIICRSLNGWTVSRKRIFVGKERKKSLDVSAAIKQL